MADEPTRDELEDALGRIRIGDLLLQTVYTLSQLSYQRLTAQPRDLAQARLGIDALAALLPVLDLPADARRDLEQMVTNLKLTYAATAAAGSDPEPGSDPSPGSDPEPPAGSDPDAEPDGAG